MAAPMPKSVSSLEKNRLLLGDFLSQNTYLSQLGWPCIYSRCLTNWIMTRIRSHWMGFFLLSVSDSVMDLERTVYLG